MTFLKWYTFVLTLLSYLWNLYRYAQNDDITGFITTLVMITPMLVYIFLS